MFGFFKKKAEPEIEQVYPYIKITENGLGKIKLRIYLSGDFSRVIPMSDSIANMVQAEEVAKNILETRRKEREIVKTSVVY
jgi:hypothetical protein